jgi:hypothetical protein
VGLPGVPSRCNFNSLLCPTALKALSARKRQFPELSNLPQAISVATTTTTTTTTKKNPSAIVSRTGVTERHDYEDVYRYALE